MSLGEHIQNRDTHHPSAAASTSNEMTTSSSISTPKGDPYPVADLPPGTTMRLNIVILFMGSRGDLQPSLAVAKLLQRRHGHRVRIASHPPYRAAVEAAGVGFYGIGRTDIKTMMERRLLPRKELSALVPVIREEFREMGERWWGACVDGFGFDHDGEDGVESRGGGGGGGGEGKERGAFVADLVMSTMHVYNQTSAAARLGVPLHLFGMNPRIFSREVPHSQAGWALKGPSRWKNVLSWWVQDFMFLEAMKSVIIDVRVNVMGLESMSPAWWLSQYNRMNVPCTYLWSPRLLPKPSDWADNIDVAGFVFEDVPSEYTPSPELAAFLEADPETPPVYIGFGSMSFANAQDVFEGIFEAARRVGVRAVVGKGWSNLVKEDVGRGGKGDDGEGEGNVGDDERQANGGAGGKRDMSHIFILDEAPHAWLFSRVRAVVCHGGSGTTAMALRSGRPTLVVPVAGDQPFWGSRIHAVGCGPEAKYGLAEMNSERFEEGLRELLKPGYAAAAERFADAVKRERPGEEVCVEKVLETVRVYEREGRCVVYDGRPAVWRVASTGKGEGGERKLSAVAAHVLVESGRVRREDLKVLEVVKWPDLTGPGDPVTGLVLGVQNAFGSVAADGRTGRWGRFGLHVLRAPLTILAAVAFGLFNLLDFILYKLASPFEPKLYASNPRLYSYPRMLLFLLSAPFVELASVVTQPARFLADGRQGGEKGAGSRRSLLRVVLEVPLALLRVLMALANVLVGGVGITLRQLDLSCARAMGERPVGDVVAEARIRQGRVEAEELKVEGVENGRDFIGDIVRRWDERKKA
ncbi:glycosyltransferase family 28 domain-containing protein [Colletotrichum scovillei]|uniref:glycosyltransferase family 28 domain-containing protein n=1 Tax=Colletotrichum scovillei TaxID=1209932 RepID=UPI0015C2F7E6|nr:glycosyltransferase family 28 domain-containing protein [Colletotrichum scovillei]KAF4785210.1 glycosyltransferase family 28 domain-containing protein [Colletotrichum scovillei]